MGMSCDTLITRFLGLVQSISIAAIEKNSVHFGLWTGSQIKGPLIQIEKNGIILIPNPASYGKSYYTFHLILKVILKIKNWIYYHWINFPCDIVSPSRKDVKMFFWQVQII